MNPVDFLLLNTFFLLAILILFAFLAVRNGKNHKSKNRKEDIEKIKDQINSE